MTPIEILQHEHRVILLVLDAAKRAAESIRKTGKAGAGTSRDLLDAKVSLSQAEAKLVEPTFDHHIACAEFERAAGRIK